MPGRAGTIPDLTLFPWETQQELKQRVEDWKAARDRITERTYTEEKEIRRKDLCKGINNLRKTHRKEMGDLEAQQKLSRQQDEEDYQKDLEYLNGFVGHANLEYYCLMDKDEEKSKQKAN